MARRWVVEVSDAVTGALLVKGHRLTAGRHVIDDPDVVAFIETKDPRFYRVRELVDDEEAPVVGSYDVAENVTSGPLTVQDIIASASDDRKPCAECGMLFKNLNQHARLTGHKAVEE